MLVLYPHRGLVRPVAEDLLVLGDLLPDQWTNRRSVIPSSLPQVANRAADAVRRASRCLPRPLHRQLHDVVEWLDRLRPAPPIEDWSGPLRGVGSRTVASQSVLAGVITAADPDAVQPEQSRISGASYDAEMPALRCLVVTGELDVGGMDEMVAFLARRLPSKGLQTAVLHATSNPSPTGEPAGRLGRMLRSSGIEVHEADESRAPDWIQRWRPDVITAHGAPDWVFAIAQQFGVPYVDNLHGIHTHFSADWRAVAARDAKVSAIVSVSELVRQQYLAGNRDYPPDRIVTISNGVDDERRVSGDRAAVRNRLGLTVEYVFVCLARYTLQKNSYGLLTAFGDLARQHPEAHLVIAGRPDESRYCRRLLRLRDELPCRDRIHLRDHAAAPAELLAAADGFVLNSFFEGWSLASMEALFAGLPVVLSEVGGAREQIGDKPERGHLVTNPLGDPFSVMDWESMGAARYRPQVNRDELVSAMHDLVANRERYLGNRGRLAAESAARFSADSCLAQHAAVLTAVATGTDLPGSADAQVASVTLYMFVASALNAAACGTTRSPARILPRIDDPPRDPPYRPSQGRGSVCAVANSWFTESRHVAGRASRRIG
jgi:glycosyltransferase involved in cell wall biosynthesis